MQQMIGNTMHCDVTLQCQEDAVQVPGLVLASISPLFKQLGILGWDTDFVMLPDFTACQIRNFIHQLLMPTRPLKNEIMGCEGAFEDILAFFQATPAPSFCTDEEIDRKQIKDIVGIDTSSAFKDLVLQSQELERSEDDEGVDSDGIFEDIENDDLSLSDDEPKIKKRIKRKEPHQLASEAKSTYNESLKLYVCPHCNLQLKAGMTNHLKWHKQHPSEVYPSRSTCEHCGKTFKKIGILRAHIVRMHSNMPKKFLCPFEGCNRAFKMRGELNTHNLIHTNAKNFICTECGLGFRTKMAMDSHTLRKHTNLKPSIPCEECGKLFRVRSDLYSHAMTHKARKERIHRCDECNLTFRTEKSLARHRELHDPTRPLACERCPLRYKNKDQLVRHIQTHEKPDIQCELCHRVFGRPDHLKRHIATKHSSLSETDQQFLSENLLLGSKKKNRQHNPSKTTQQSNNQQILSQHQLPEVLPVPKTTIIQAITTPISLQTNTDTTTTDRPESELSTISVAELNNAITVHPNQAFQTASSSAGSSAQNSAASTAIQPQYRHAPHQMDYSQMFQISLTQTTISTNPDEL